MSKPPPKDEPKAYAATFLDWEALDDAGDPPRREWAMEHWLGMGYTTLLAAKGGMGKSILAQQIGTALCLQKSFVAQMPQSRSVLAWMGEDDDNEMWRRQTAICAKFGVTLSDLRDRFFAESMTETDCCLLAKVGGMGLVRTSMLKELREQIGDTHAEVVILDNVAKLFSGNENDRYEVTAFLTAINWAASVTNAAVLLISHVAKGPNSEFSGSTAWENAVRSRWWLTDSPPDQEPNPEKDAEINDLRYLAKRKVNYSERDICVLRYEDGAYTMIGQPAGGSQLLSNIRKGAARNVVLTGAKSLQIKGVFGTDAANAPAFLPKVIMQYGLADGYSKLELARGMRELIMDGELIKATIGQYANRTPKIGLKPKEEL